MISGLPERINAKISPEPNSGCWLWAGAKTGSNGPYGLTREPVTQRKIGAHRFIYEFVNGSIPQGMELDHKCRNRFCVNPDHLEAVTHKENVHRGLSAPKNRCINGHEKPFGKPCKICNTERARRYKAEEIASRPPKTPPPPRTTCSNGHPWNEKNIGKRKGVSGFYCRVCNAASTQKWRLKYAI